MDRALSGLMASNRRSASLPSHSVRRTVIPVAGPAVLVLLVCLSASTQGPPQVVRDDLTVADRERVTAILQAPTDFSKTEPFETLSGGAATFTGKADAKAFGHLSTNVPFEDRQSFVLGGALFGKLWVSSPSSTQASDGLGPLFNARSCESCHIKAGRGRPQEEDGSSLSLFARLARPAETRAEQQAVTNHQALNLPDPVYGRQLQAMAVPGLPVEGKLTIGYTERAVTLADDEVVSLRAPTYGVTGLSQGPLDAATTLSPRMAPQLIGLGLIEAIHETDILAHADPDDRDGDGISGRAALVRDHQTGQTMLGRFGWKAQNPTVHQQNAEAFANDISISTPAFPNSHGDCTPKQADCLAAPDGVQPRLGTTEAPDPVLDLVTFYARHLAVPARRNSGSPTVLQGKQVFYQTGCATCHTPKFVTRRDASDPSLSFQLIWPYTDLLLHDMGPELADGQSVGVATGQEWRTPPLWGIGLSKQVNGNGFYLHDGRARSLAEAILWHGGEATSAKTTFTNLPKQDREALISFLESL